MIALAELIVDDLAAGGAGKIDLDEAARRCVSAQAGMHSCYYYILGDYLDVHGKPDAAVECWKRAMLDTWIDVAGRTLAGARLLKRGIGADAYGPALRTPMTKEELEKGPGTPPKLRHPPDATEFDGHFYKFIPAKDMYWNLAKEQCEFMGGQLACITNVEENDFIVKLCAQKEALLGGHLEHDKWTWVSGEPFEFQRWSPMKSRSSCLKLLRDGFWFTQSVGSGEAEGYVCEWER